MPDELNLLPTSRRRVLARRVSLEVVRRFLQVIVFNLVALTAVGVVAVVVLQILVLTSSHDGTVELDEYVSQYQRLRDDIAEQNLLLSDMERLGSQRVVWPEWFSSVFAVMPPGTAIEQMSGNFEQRTLTFSGEAAARSTLVVLEDKLGDLPWVKQVTAPHSNLLERINPAYQFILTAQLDIEEEE